MKFRNKNYVMTFLSHETQNWKLIKIKYVFEEIFGGSWGKDPHKNQTTGLVKVIRVSEFEMNSLNVKEKISTSRSLEIDKSSPKLVRMNDLILEKSGGGEKTSVGRVVLIDRQMKYPTVNSNFTNLLRPNKLVEPKFLVFSLNALYIKGITKRHIKQTTGIQNLDTQGFINEKIILPPLEEQKLISQYLERKTQKIDSLIQKIEKKIELLNEQKTIMINQYLTKGLDPTFERKDSGYEWIGEIPKHWNKIKINYIVDVRDGTHDTPVYLDDKNGFPLVTQKDIYGGKLDFSKTRYISFNDHELISKRSKVLKNDIVMSMIGSIGFPTIVDTDKEFSIKNLALFKTSNSSENTEFIKFVLESKYINSQLELEKGGGVQNFVSLETLRNLKIFIPSIAEQNRIVIFLKKKINRIHKLIDYELKKNDLIKEYRQSLISSVVTGKIRITEDMI